MGLQETLTFCSQLFIRTHNEAASRRRRDVDQHCSLNKWIQTALSNSRNAVSISSACTTNRCPSSRCASTIQIVRPSRSTAERQPQLQPALLRLSTPCHPYQLATDRTCRTMSFVGIIASVFPHQEHMNKRRKILTVLALAIFGVIIFFHYYSLGYDGGHRSIQYMTAAEKAAGIQHGWKIVAAPTPAPTPPPKANVFDQFDRKPPSAASPRIAWLDDIIEPGFEKVVVEHPGVGLFWSDRYPGITDVRMPLFVLAVFYTGLFFILGGPTATKNLPPNP